MSKIRFSLFFIILLSIFSQDLVAQELPQPQGPPEEFEDGPADRPRPPENIMDESANEATSILDELPVSADEFADNPDLPFTGTLAEDDPENDEEDLFDDEGSEEEPPAEELSDQATHLLHFEFTGLVQFAENKAAAEMSEPTGEPYLEIEYRTKFETPVQIKIGRSTINVDTEYDIDIWGNLAEGELFTCKLDISIEKIATMISLKLQKPKVDKEAEEVSPLEIVNSPLAIKIEFSKDTRENWFSLCKDIGGAELNTRGEQEEYLIKLLNAIEPSLRGHLLEEFDPLEETQIELAVTTEIVDDVDIANDITLSGSGKLTFEPLQ